MRNLFIAAWDNDLRINEITLLLAIGDLDKDFIDLSLLGLIFLEYIVYALPLKRYGAIDSKIQNAINDL